MVLVNVLPRPNVLIVLLEYIDLFQSDYSNMQQTFGRRYPTLYHSILLYFILSIATVIILAYFTQICS